MKILAYSSRWGFSIPIALRKFKEVVPALIILCSTFFITPLTAQVSLNATASADPVNVGDNFTLDIDIDAGTQDVNTVGIELTFDPAVFQIIGNTPGTTLPTSVGGVSIDNTNGTVNYAASILSQGASANGTFNIISFDVDVVGGAGVENIDFVLGLGNTEVLLNGSNIAFTPNDLNITVNAPNSTPVINSIGNSSVDEGGNIQIPLSISDADGDNLTVSVTTISNEPQELQSNNNGAQTDPYPFDASAFFAENNMVSGPGSYTSSLDFNPTFGDGGSNGDGSGVYTITIQVDDEDGNTVTETFDLTVNDVHQALSASGVVRIEAESYDDQGNTGGGVGIGVEEGSSVINIGFTTPNDFAEYLIDVPVAGTYQFDFAVAKASGPTGTMTINGDANQTISVTNTGGWQAYSMVSVNVSLAAGQQTLSFVWTGPSGFFFNADYFDVSLISDVIPPVITLLGANPLDIPLNGVCSDPGATASDDIDGNITGNIVVGGDVVDVSTAGAYTVTYDVSDAAGNSATQVSRTVNILPATDNPPSIAAISDVAVNEGDNINIAITVSDDNTPNATIEIFDKSAGGTVSTSPVSSVPDTPISGYNFTGSAGSYTLDWTPGAGDGR
ncbi:MAG: immunoglobulin-like domain-containing protein, partial [Bacteroidota bacterium]